MGATRSKSASNLSIPDINSLPSSERPKAMEDLVSIINDQRIAFGFRKVEPDTRGQEILKSVATGMSFLPEYSIRVEGHSNLAKPREKLAAQDQARIQKLSEDRAATCALLLKAAGVQNEITSVGQGALTGEKTGCVRLVLCKKWTPPQPKVEQSQQPEAEVKVDVADTLAEVKVDVADTLTPETTAEDASIAQITGDHLAPDTTAEDASIAQITGDQVLQGSDPASEKEAQKPSEPEKTEQDLIEPLVADPEESSKKCSGPPDLAATATPPPVVSAKVEAWGNTNIPWYITCCSQTTKPQVDEGVAYSPFPVLPVKQMQLLQ
jgi:hypothetical protein